MSVFESVHMATDMGLFAWTLVTATLTAGFYLIFRNQAAKPLPIKDGWWGRGSMKPDKDEEIRPFKIEVPDDVIANLKERLARTRLGEDLEDTQFHYGFQEKYLRVVLEYWRNEYEWRLHEKELNKFQQYKTTIEGIEIHFLRVNPASKAGQKSVRPILIAHGWPGSVWEFYKLIPRLTDPAKYGGRDEDAFEVICPSIPGFGFSEAPHQQGFTHIAAAQVFHKLMTRLGHRNYYIQGGDWGGTIATTMAQAYPQSILGAHLNFVLPATNTPGLLIKKAIARFFPSLILHPEDRRDWQPRSVQHATPTSLESGYTHIQATKPDTVAVGLNDSPAGLAAYILEKFSTWTNPNNRDLPDGGLTEKFTLDELLTNVMIYWVQGNIGSSVRFYKERALSEAVKAFDLVPVTVPTGIASFPKELLFEPEAFIAGKYQNIVQYTRMPRGGHFPAFEEPGLLADDIINFVRKVEGS